MYTGSNLARRVFLSAILSVFACLLLATPALAQTETTGAIEGQIVDDQGNGVPGVVVQFINQETQVPSATKTDDQGRFAKLQLQPGLYTIVVRVPQGFQAGDRRTQRVFLTEKRETLPPIKLEREIAAAPTPTPAPGGGTPEAPTTPRPAEDTGTKTTSTGTSGDADLEEVVDIRSEINRTDGRRGGSYGEEEVSTLPLGGSTRTRTFDELALLLPGVAPPPQTSGDIAGPGIGAGVGSAGQFSVNGLRSRGNNFTVDGSDNNDEDIGVRRQGFLALVPQPVESIKEYRVTTLLAPAQFGRNFGAQVNAVSKSGSNQTHGTFFGFLNTSQLNSRNFFDTTNGSAVTPLRANGQNVLLRTENINRVVIDERPLTVRNGSGGEDSFTLGQGGFVLGGPLVPSDPTNPSRRSLFYFISAEGQILNATKEASFAVPTIAQRGILGSGETGLFGNPITGAPVFGDVYGRSGAGVFSLFPFPNDPTGVYGENTFTRTLPASGFGKIISGKANGNFSVGGKQQEITARYNFTDDARTIPVTGGAIFSSLRPRVRTQNFSTFLNSEITGTISNELRASYGRTRLIFDEVPDREFLLPSETLPNEPFLLNAPYVANITRPAGVGVANTGPVIFFRRPGDPLRTTSENVTGPVGQVKVAGFSTLGVDVFNFPQRRVNNTYQLADTLNVNAGAHRLTFGADIRRVELNSDLPRNSRPLLVYAGSIGGPDLQEILTGVRLDPTDFVAAGAPSGALQTFTTTGASAIGLRYYQYYFFGQDEWRIRPNLSLSFGLRYEYNTVPGETSRRIESTFNSPAIDDLLPGLNQFLEGRTEIYDPERMNFAPRVGIAYSRNLFGPERATVFRAGYGIYYDQIIGAVVSQSRNVFPNFLTLNFGGGRAQFGGGFELDLFNPANVGFNRFDANGNFIRFDTFRRPGTLNQINPAVAGNLGEFVDIINEFFPVAGFGVTLPSRQLKTPVAHHYSLTVEQQLTRNMVASFAYIGTQGRHLLRVNTPNAGENVGLVPFDFDFISGTTIPILLGIPVSPSFPSSQDFERPNSGVGAVNLIESTANSRYDALQAQLRGRFNSNSYTSGLLYQVAYTFGKAIDDVSDVFDLAGAPALPQDATDFRAERGPANFDVRHRVSYNLTYGLPLFNDRSRAFRAIFGGLEIASTGQFQTGQPFTVNSIFDVNGDGNFTDRLDSTNGLVVTGDRRQPLQLTGPAAADPSILLAGSFTNGSVGRNTFRASNLMLFNVAFIKNIRITESQALTFRTEIFNLTDRDNFGIPVRLLEAPGFGQATETVTPGRRIQFALKYSF